MFSVEQTKLFLKFVNSLAYKHFKPKIVSEQLGHTSTAFTLDVYSHALPHMQDDAAAKVEAALMGKYIRRLIGGPSTISDKHRDRAPQSTAQPARRRCHICEGES